MRFTEHLKHILSKEASQLVLTIPILIGLGILWYFALSTEPDVNLGIKAVLAAGGLALVFRRFSFSVVFTIASLMALGFLSAQLRTDTLKGPLLHEPLFAANVEGRVHQVTLEEDGVKLVLDEPSIDKLPSSKTPRRVRINVKGDKAENLPPVGSVIRVRASLFPLPAPASPGAFDFGRYLYFEGLGAVGAAVSAPEIVSESKRSAIESIHHFREGVAKELIARIPDGRGAIAAALTVGEQRSVSEADIEALRASGLYHILSISGLHLALAAGIVFYVVRLLLVLIPGAALRLPVKKISASVALVSAFLYLLAAGWPVPAQRSFIMVAVVLVAVLFDRKGISLITLAWAAMLILLLRPESLMGASFQLSFAATAAIVVLYERYGNYFYKPGRSFIGKLIGAIIATMLVSLAATLATAPFIITHFNQLQLLGVLANAAVTPVVSFIIMPAVVLVFLLLPFGLISLAAIPLGFGIKLMMDIAHGVAALPYASIAVPSYTAWGFALSIIGFLLLVGLKTRAHYAGAVLMLIGVISMAFTQTPNVLIAAEGKQVAVRDAKDQWVMLKGKTSSFTVDMWMKQLGQKEAIMPKAAQFDERTALKCSESDCVYQCNNSSVLLMKQAPKTKERCTKDYTLAVLPFKLWEGECEGVRVIDKTALRERGAHAVYCDGGTLHVSDVKTYQGERPWVP